MPNFRMKGWLYIAMGSLCLTLTLSASARRHSARYDGLPRTEGELVSRVLNCLQHQDTIGYFNLFPPFDTLWHMVMHNPDNSPEGQRALAELREHPRELVEFDPYYNPAIMDRFCYVLEKGRDSGLGWADLQLARYELQKQPLTRNLQGYDRVAPDRFMGYVFVRNRGENNTFCITLTEMQKINGHFAGGQVNNIMEAGTIDEYNARAAYETNYIIELRNAMSDSTQRAIRRDSLHTDSLKKGWVKVHPADTLGHYKDSLKAHGIMAANVLPADEEGQKIRREVVDRKYYEGKFDDEIPVELYVRYMKDVNNDKTMFWDALYKFGDQKSYIKLEVTKTGEKWDFDDDPPVGSMELVLKNHIYTGSWVNNETQSGYDVVLKETVISPRKLEKLEKILEEGLAGRSDEPNAAEDRKANKKKQKNKNSGTKAKAMDND